ncbi:uncharacterized protein FFB14_04966 [Fusarium fujikuroi]|nr:uncharacterized protein FFB14_04966 [Fusarium fujikuroi]
MSANQDLVLANGEASPVINVEFVPLGEPNEDTEPNSMDYEVNDEHAVNPPPWFPTAAQVGTGVSISWYNAWLKAWLSWGHHRVLTINACRFRTPEGSCYQAQVRPSTTTIMIKRENEIDQYRVKNALQAFPSADSLQIVEGPWHHEPPRVRDQEPV